VLALAVPWAEAAQRPRAAAPYVEIEGNRRLWQPLRFVFHASTDTHESLHAPGENPFLDHRLRVTFVHEASGARRVVQGYYAGDGHAGDTSAEGGDAWCALFAPDVAGLWVWSAEFRRGPSIAITPSLTGTVADARIDGAFGTFHALPADPGAPGFYSRGRLDHVGEPYLRFAETHEPYLKNGAGGPENFMAYWEFDGTIGDSANQCLQAPEHLHRYLPHAADFVPDATGMAHLWGPMQRGQNILGAIDYLQTVGVNSLYFLTNTWRGDGKDTWPWTTPQDKAHFDVSKLDQWDRVFTHMSARGIQLQVVFEEGENDQISVPAGGMGNGLTPERKLYYRELIARFAHHPAVLWVIGDESNYFDEIPVMESLASEIRALDPYRHPITFHSKHPCFGECAEPYPSVVQQYQPYFGFNAFEVTAFQTAPGGYNSSTIQLRQGQASSRKWAHFGDEQSLNATPVNLTTNRTKALWGNLMGGGSGVAWYPGNDYPSQYPPGTNVCDYFDLTAEDMRVFQPYFDATRHAVTLFHQELPFTEMFADNALASVNQAADYVFRRLENAATGTSAVYAVYRGTGTATDLTIGPGTHSVDWFDPRTGAGPFPASPLVGPGAVLLEPPPMDPGEDWLAVVRQL